MSASITSALPRVRCRRCGASFIWVQAVGGTMLPLDPEPCATGTIAVVLERQGAVTVLRAYPRPDRWPIGAPRHNHHWKTCAGDTKRGIGGFKK